MNLFAIYKDRVEKILRIQTDNGLQAYLSEMYKEMYLNFQSNMSGKMEFDGRYKTDPGEYAFIKDFDGAGKIIESLQSAVSVDVFDQKFHDLENIKALFTSHKDNNTGKDIVIVQKFDKRKIITAKGGSLFLSGGVFKRVEGDGLTIPDKISAIYDGRDLIFESFYMAKQVFDLSEHYRVATDSDILRFLSLPKVQFQNPNTANQSCNTWIRRRIALIESSGVLDIKPLTELVDIAKTFGVDLNITAKSGADALLFPEDRAELKKVVGFLEEEYFTTAITGTRCRTNSRTNV